MLKIQIMELLQIVVFNVCGTMVLMQPEKPIWLGLIMYGFGLVILALVLFSQNARAD